jgi:hypothetical protein
MKPEHGKERQRRSYEVGARFTHERMEREAPLDAAALRSIEAADIVVVPGSYDRVEQVLAALGLPHTLVTTAQLPSVRLRPEQLLVINCPGSVPGQAIGHIRRFLETGGSLFTTDWALKLLERVTPAMVKYNQHPTADDVVRIEIAEHDNPFLNGVIGGSDEPVWWLEGSSFPVIIIDPAVRVLIKSSELADKYGESPVALTYPFGKGEVFHMISHYYLQRTELRTRRHQMAATAYATEKRLTVDAPLAARMKDLTLGEVESAATSARLFANIAAGKKRREADRDERGG